MFFMKRTDVALENVLYNSMALVTLLNLVETERTSRKMGCERAMKLNRTSFYGYCIRVQPPKRFSRAFLLWKKIKRCFSKVYFFLFFVRAVYEIHTKTYEL